MSIRSVRPIPVAGLPPAAGCWPMPYLHLRPEWNLDPAGAGEHLGDQNSCNIYWFNTDL